MLAYLENQFWYVNTDFISQGFVKLCDSKTGKSISKGQKYDIYTHMDRLPHNTVG